MFVWVCTRMCKCPQRLQERSDLPELVLQVIMSFPKWMLGTELCSRISNVLNCQAISPAHFNLIFVAVGVDLRGHSLTRQAIISHGAVSPALTLALWLSHKQQLTMEKPFSPPEELMCSRRYTFPWCTSRARSFPCSSEQRESRWSRFQSCWL